MDMSLSVSEKVATRSYDREDRTSNNDSGGGSLDSSQTLYLITPPTDVRYQQPSGSRNEKGRYSQTAGYS